MKDYKLKQRNLRASHTLMTHDTHEEPSFSFFGKKLGPFQNASFERGPWTNDSKRDREEVKLHQRYIAQEGERIKDEEART